MKVRDALNSSSGIAEIQGKEDRKAVDSRQTSFQSQLKHVESRNYEEKIRNLADQIQQQGDKLGKKVDVRELKVYKKLVSEFLDEVVRNSHKFSKQNFLDRRGRHRVYASIKKVNEELDLLTRDVLNEEKDNIRILQRLDDIRGLILDLAL